MPQVPQVLPSVQPQGGGSGYLQTQDPTMAFGYGIGKAQEQLGSTLERTGDMLEKHANLMQDRANQAWGNDAFVQGVQQAAEITNWHKTLRGMESQNALPDVMRKLDAVREGILSSAPNKEAARNFDQDFKRRQAYMIQDAAGNAATQVRQYQTQAAQARQVLAVQSAGNAQGDDEFKFEIESGLKGIDTESKVEGWSPGVIDVKKQTLISKAWQSRLETIAMTDPFRAEKLYKENKESILDPETRMHIERNLIQQFNSVGTGHDQSSIVNGTPFKQFPTVGGGTNREAIASVETGHIKGEEARYTAEGPIVQTGRFAGQRAIGKYQIMENNVRDWTKEVLGKEMTPAEFKKDHDAQDKVFDAKFGQLVEKYGNFQDAASAWHSGRPLAEAIKAGATDSYMRTEDYVKKATAALGQGAGPLTTESGPEWLRAASDRARAIAAARLPGEENDARRQAYEHTLITRVTGEYNNVRTANRAVEQENYNTVLDPLINKVDPSGKPTYTSMDQIFSDPVLNAAYNALPSARQAALRDRIVRNSKADVPLTDERLKQFNEMMGTATTNPDEFLKIDPKDLPFSLQKQIYTAQRAIQKNQATDPGFQRALTSVHGLINDAGFGPSRTDRAQNARYNQFVGAFQTARQQWIQDNNNKTPTRDDNEKIAVQLLADTERPGRFFGTNTYSAFEVPSYEEDKIREAYKTKLGVVPTPRQIYEAYQRKLSLGR